MDNIKNEYKELIKTLEVKELEVLKLIQLKKESEEVYMNFKINKEEYERIKDENTIFKSKMESKKLVLQSQYFRANFLLMRECKINVKFVREFISF